LLILGEGGLGVREEEFVFDDRPELLPDDVVEGLNTLHAGCLLCYLQ